MRRPAGQAPHPSLTRALLLGAAAIAVPMLLHALLLPVWGAGTTPLFIVFLLSLLPASGVAFICAGEGVLRMGYAMCLVIGAAFLSLSLNQARVFGGVPSLAVTAAPAHPAAAGFLLPDAAPRADLARDIDTRIALPRRDMRGRATASAILRGRFTVAPVVAPGWTPGQPVAVVAVLDHGPDGVADWVAGAPWDAGRGVLRLLPDPLRDAAVQLALREAGWEAAPGLVIGRWVADPRWARLHAASPLLSLLALAWLGWALVILSGHPVLAARLEQALPGPETAGREILAGIAALTLPALLALGLRHAGVEIGIAVLALAFAAIPSLMLVIGATQGDPPVGILIAAVILVVTLPIGMLARGAGPRGDLPSLTGARLEDLQEGMILLGVGWLAWAVLVLLGRWLQGRRR